MFFFSLISYVSDICNSFGDATGIFINFINKHRAEYTISFRRIGSPLVQRETSATNGLPQRESVTSIAKPEASHGILQRVHERVALISLTKQPSIPHESKIKQYMKIN